MRSELPAAARDGWTKVHQLDSTHCDDNDGDDSDNDRDNKDEDCNDSSDNFDYGADFELSSAAARDRWT